MGTSLKAKLFAAAQNNSGLVNLLGGGSPLILRWFDQQLPQISIPGAQQPAFPAVVVQQVSNPRTYVVNGRMPTSFNRMQFTIYGTGNDSSNADQVANALVSFLDQYSQSCGISGLTQYSNLIVSDRDFGIAQTQPLTYMRKIDAMIFDNETL